MKPIFFKILFSAWLALPMPCAFAQFSVGPDLGFPSGSWSDWGDAGFGASVRYESTIHANLNWTASLGFISFIGRSYNFRVPSATYTNEFISPLTGGIKYYFQKTNAGIYGAAEAGLFFANNNQGTKVGFSPGLGYRLERFDFSFRYNLVSDLSYWALRAAYIFPHR